MLTNYINCLVTSTLTDDELYDMIPAIWRRQVRRNLAKARQRYAEQPTDTALAWLDYWQRQEERAK